MAIRKRRPTVKISPNRKRQRKPRGIKGFKIDLDMRTIAVTFTGGIINVGELHAYVIDGSRNPSRTIGVMRLTYPQWRKLNAFGNRLFRAHRKLSRTIK